MFRKPTFSDTIKSDRFHQQIKVLFEMSTKILNFKILICMFGDNNNNKKGKIIGSPKLL